MRQRATHITLKCSYSEHKWAVIKDRRESYPVNLHLARSFPMPLRTILRSPHVALGGSGVLLLHGCLCQDAPRGSGAAKLQHIAQRSSPECCHRAARGF